MNESKVYTNFSLINEESFKKKMGSRIREVRKQHDLTLKELSLLSGIAYSYLGTIERGESTPSMFICFKICNAMNISIETLVEPVQATILNENHQSLAQKIYHMVVTENTNTQILILDVVNAVLNFNEKNKSSN